MEGSYFFEQYYITVSASHQTLNLCICNLCPSKKTEQLMITKLINTAGPPLRDHHEDLPLHCFYVFQVMVLGYLHLHFIYNSFIFHFTE